MTDQVQQSLKLRLSGTGGNPAEAYAPRCTHVGFELRCLLPPDHSGDRDYGSSTDLVAELQRLREENQALRTLADNLQPGPISVALGGAAHEQPYREAAQALRPDESSTVPRMTAAPATEANEAANAAIPGAGGALRVRCVGGRADGVMYVQVPKGFRMHVGALWELRPVACAAATDFPADQSRTSGGPHPSNGPYTAEQVFQMRDALREIDQMLESSKWYDGEDARESLLERLGCLVQRSLP